MISQVALGAAESGLVERNAGGHPGVERLGRCMHGNRKDLIALLSYQSAQALALTTDDEDKRPVKKRAVTERVIGVGIQAGDHAPGFGEVLKRSYQVCGLGNGHPRSRPC